MTPSGCNMTPGCWRGSSGHGAENQVTTGMNIHVSLLKGGPYWTITDIHAMFEGSFLGTLCNTLLQHEYWDAVTQWIWQPPTEHLCFMWFLQLLFHKLGQAELFVASNVDLMFACFQPHLDIDTLVWQMTAVTWVQPQMVLSLHCGVFGRLFKCCHSLIMNSHLLPVGGSTLGPLWAGGGGLMGSPYPLVVQEHRGVDLPLVLIGQLYQGLRLFSCFI